MKEEAFKEVKKRLDKIELNDYPLEIHNKEHATVGESDNSEIMSNILFELKSINEKQKSILGIFVFWFVVSIISALGTIVSTLLVLMKGT